MTIKNGMMLWTDAYLADTGHLTTIEHGAYLLILMAMWRSADGRLPNDDSRLARTAHLTLDKWRRVGPIIRKLLTVDGDFVTQKRLRLEREIATSKKEKRIAAGIAGSAAKSLKTNKPTQAMLIESEINAHAPNPAPLEKKKDGASAPPMIVDPDADLFRRGKEVLGSNAGSLIARLKKSKGGSIPHARAAIEQASTKASPREYIGRIINSAGQSASDFRDNPTAGSLI